jgi:hypothetical protein
MSLDDVTRFLEEVVSDPSIEATMDAAGRDKGDVAAVAVALGQKHGLLFTEEEFVRTVDAARRQHDGDLTDEMLDDVAGGFNPQPTPPASGDMSFRDRTRPPWLTRSWARGWR